jgi:hypothetical protein
LDLLRTGSKASQAGADDHGNRPMGRVLYPPSWTTWPGRWMHVSPTLFNCTNPIVDASAQSQAEKSVTQEIAGVCCESRVGVGLRQPLGSQTGLGMRGERREPASRSESPTHLLAVPCTRLQRVSLTTAHEAPALCALERLANSWSRGQAHGRSCSSQNTTTSHCILTQR